MLFKRLRSPDLQSTSGSLFDHLMGTLPDEHLVWLREHDADWMSGLENQLKTATEMKHVKEILGKEENFVPVFSTVTVCAIKASCGMCRVLHAQTKKSLKYILHCAF